MEPYCIYTWSLRTGKILEILTGHEGPISRLAFSPKQGTLASSSWDGTVKLWDPYSSGEAALETLSHKTDVLSLAFRPGIYLHIIIICYILYIFVFTFVFYLHGV